IFFFQAEDGIRAFHVTGVQTCALPILEDLPADLLVSDLYGARSEAFTRILDQIGESRKIIFIIPEYNGSFPGVLKLFMDACEYQIGRASCRERVYTSLIPYALKLTVI